MGMSEATRVLRTRARVVMGKLVTGQWRHRLRAEYIDVITTCKKFMRHTSEYVIQRQRLGAFSGPAVVNVMVVLMRMLHACFRRCGVQRRFTTVSSLLQHVQGSAGRGSLVWRGPRCCAVVFCMRHLSVAPCEVAPTFSTCTCHT